MNGNLYRAVLTSGSCTPVNSDSATLTVGSYPTALLLTGHDFCASAPNTGSITSSTSVSGVSYQLYDSSDVVVQSAKNGTGSGLTWSNLSSGTGYYVIGTGAAPTSCTSTSAPANVAQISNPAALLLTGHDFCASAPNTGSITSSTSVSGVSYQLYDSSDVVVQSAKNGTGSGLTWSNLSAGTGYYVIGTGAAPTSCTSTSAPANVVQINNPAALLLTGHDFCASAPNTGSITSSTSVSGVSYQLYDSSDAVVQSAKNGTGSGLTWSNLSAGTGYYVIGTGAAPTSCTSTSAPTNVAQINNPAALLLTGHDFCASAPNTGSITSSTSVSGVSYQLYDSSDAVVQSAKNGTGSGLTWSNLSAGTGYYVIGTGAAPTSCTSTSAPANVVQINNPAALLLTGHDFCASAPNTGSITSSTSVSGVSYQLYDSSDAVVQSAKNGTGSGLTWSNLSAGTGYYVIGTGAAPTSCTSTSAPANVAQINNPAALLLTGHDFCASVPNTGSITSSTSVSGVSYQLYDSSDAVVQSAKNGTGSGLTWSNLSAGTGYYVIGTGAAPTSCTSTSAPANVAQINNPAALLLTGHDFCASAPNTGSITSSTSVSGVSYQLYNSSDAVVQSAKNGTGSGLTWSNLSAGTGYYVIGTGAAPTSCTSTSAPTNVAQINNPAALLLTGHDFCASAPNTGSITSSTSVSGVSYQLYDSSDAVVQSAKNGTGSGLTWSNLSAGTGYYVIGTGAAPTSCTSTSAPANVAQINNPAALLLTGHDFCASAPNTGSITSSTSVSGVSYQLYDSSDAVVQSAKNGTGNGLTWSNLSAGTGYYVIGTGAAPTSCTSTSAPANVVQVTNPTALLLTGHDFCASAPNTGSITSSTSVSGVSYQLYNSSNAVVQSAKNGTGSGLTWSNLSAGTGYYVIGTGAAPTSCTSTSAPANVVQINNPVALLLTGHDFCSSSPNTGSITSSTSVSGVSYQLYNSSDAVVQSAKNGTGSGLTWSNLSAGTGYYVIGTGAAPTSCTSTSAPANVVQNQTPILVITTPTAPCTPGKVNLTVNAVTANSTLPSGTVLTYYNDNNGAVGTQMTNTQAAAVGVGTYWIKATSLANCTDIKSVTIAVNNCGGLIYPTQTTCTSYLNNQPPLDKICFTVTKKGSKSTISNATPGVFFYYATIIAPSNGNLTIEVLQFNTSSPHVKEFAIQQDQVFLFDNNCTKIATGKEAPKGSGQATVTIPNAIKDRTYVISVKYDTKTIISQTAPSADYQSYFISKVNGNVVNSTAGNILVSNCSAPTAPTAVVKTADTIAPTDVTTTSKIKPADFTAYPVPFKDQLTIRYNFDYKSDVKIEVFNALGIMVLTKHDADGYLNKEVLLDLTNAGQEGIYIVKVSTNRGSSTKKVISSR